MLAPIDLLLVAAAAMAAGAVNAVAGGGTLITFPILVAVGVPAVAANVTNTVALCPGFLGAAFAQAADLRDQRSRLTLLLPAAATGGVIGAMLLLNTGERAFREMIPFLILLASALLAMQERLRAWLLQRRGSAAGASQVGPLAAAAMGIAAIYGGYFGAGLSVIVLAALGLILDDTLTRLNALKQTVSFTINLAAAVFFAFSGEVVWPVAGVMAVGALVGGALGGRLAGRIRPAALRWTVVSVGVAIAMVYLARS